MNTETISTLTHAIEGQFGSPCTFLRAQRVRKAHKGRMIWTGTVGVFQLARDGSTCFAWADDMMVGLSHPVIVPASAAVTSPAEAVESYILGLCDAALETPSQHAA